MREERSGTTAAPNRSTVIRIRLWIDTNDETSARKTCSLPKAWPGAPPIRHEPTCNSASRTGNSEDYWIKQIWHGHVHDQWVKFVFLKLEFCRQWFRWENFRAKQEQRSDYKQLFFQVFLLTEFIRLGKLWELDTLAVVLMWNVSLRVSIRALTLRPIIRLRLHTWSKA